MCVTVRIPADPESLIEFEGDATASIGNRESCAVANAAKLDIAARCGDFEDERHRGRSRQSAAGSHGQNLSSATTQLYQSAVECNGVDTEPGTIGISSHGDGYGSSHRTGRSIIRDADCDVTCGDRGRSERIVQKVLVELEHQPRLAQIVRIFDRKDNAVLNSAKRLVTSGRRNVQEKTALEFERHRGVDVIV